MYRYTRSSLVFAAALSGALSHVDLVHETLSDSRGSGACDAINPPPSISRQFSLHGYLLALRLEIVHKPAWVSFMAGESAGIVDGESRIACRL